MKVQRMYNHLGNRCETISSREKIIAPRRCHGQGNCAFDSRRSYVKESLPRAYIPAQLGGPDNRAWFHLSTRIGAADSNERATDDSRKSLAIHEIARNRRFVEKIVSLTSRPAILAVITMQTSASLIDTLLSRTRVFAWPTSLAEIDSCYRPWRYYTYRANDNDRRYRVDKIAAVTAVSVTQEI